MSEQRTLVLEVYAEDAKIRMSIYAKEATETTIRQYSDNHVSYLKLEQLSQDIFSLLSQANQRGELAQDLFKELKKSGHLLYDYILSKAVKERLFNAQEENLIFSLDERLVYIPWEALFDGNDFLCLKFNLGRSVRTKYPISELRYRSSERRLKMLILANPGSDLPAAQREAVDIMAAIDKKRNLIHADFKSGNIEAGYVEKNIRDYDILHYAGHAYYKADAPKESGWVLSDRDLTVKDILKIGESQGLPGIVFANACESAKASEVVPNSEGNIYNLANAFLLSGVRHYIGTVYKISDEAAPLFAKEFYLQLIQGRSVGEAVRHARLKLIHKFTHNQLAWLGYVLYGDPNFVPFRQRRIKSLLKYAKKPRLFSKKILAAAAIVVIVLTSGLLIHKYNLTFNPNSYFLISQVEDYFKSGENSKAIAVCNNIIKRDPDFQLAYSRLGDIYDRIGQRSKALKYYFEYCRHSEKKKDYQSLARGYIKIGWLYYNLGDYVKSHDFYKQAVGLTKRIKNELLEAEALRKLAVWHIDKENYEDALALLLKSSEINRARAANPKHLYNLACDYFDMALLFTDKDDFPAAREFYNKSLKIFKSLNQEADLSDYYCNVGEIYKFEKEYQKALEYYAKSMQIDRKLGNLPSLAATLNIVGELYLEIKDYKNAEENFQESLKISSGIDDRVNTAATSENLALLYQEMKK